MRLFWRLIDYTPYFPTRFSLTCHIRQEALDEEVVHWREIVKEAADRQLAKIVDGSRERGGEVV